jgi:hypothetical protein
LQCFVVTCQFQHRIEVSFYAGDLFVNYMPCLVHEEIVAVAARLFEAQQVLVENIYIIQIVMLNSRFCGGHIFYCKNILIQAPIAVCFVGIRGLVRSQIRYNYF